MWRANSGNLASMKRVQRASGLLFPLMIACGGSSSETPMPLEPVPHSGAERSTADKSETIAPPEETDTQAEETDTQEPITSDDDDSTN